MSRQSQTLDKQAHTVQSAKPSRSAPVHRGASNPTMGNQSAQRLLRDGVIQAKLTVNQPGDRFEQQADRVADAVMRSGDATAALGAPPHIQRKCGECGAIREIEDGKRIQRRCAECEAEQERAQLKAKPASSPQGTAAAEQQISRAQDGGQPLPEPLRADFEQLQRQPEDDFPELTGPQSPPAQTAPAPTPVVPIRQPAEPGCPPGGSNLGNLQPDPPCDQSDQVIDGLTLKFCLDSDVFKDIARELVNAGVREDRMEVIAKGPTDRFDSGTTEAHRANNRVVVIGSSLPFTPGSAGLPQNATLRQIADEAKASIERGEYFLGADAYVARWTCGRFRSLSDIVGRTTIKVEGPDFTTGLSTSPFAESTIERVGLNVIKLFNDIVHTTNPLTCAQNRIADLAFHHFARPQIPNFDEQHQGGLHMLHLGGFSACTLQPDFGRGSFDVPTPNDPKAGLQPPCAEQPLPGAISPQKQTNPPANRPTFSVNILDVTAASGALIDQGGFPLLDMVSPPDTIKVNAEVTAAGDPGEIPHYDVGFVQTIMTENRSSTYVSGRRLITKLPVPLRDGPRRSHPRHDPPWFDSLRKVQAQSGKFAVQLRDAPGMQVPTRFIDLSRTAFARRREFPRPGSAVPLVEDRPAFIPARDVFDPVSTAKRRTVFNTWLVARRNTPPAPVSAFSTEFLAGKRIVFTADADFVTRAVTRAQGKKEVTAGTGSFRVDSSDAPAGAQTSIQFHGATPGDFASPRVALFNELMVSEGAAPRSPSGGLTAVQLVQELARIADRPRRTRGLLGELVVSIQFDLGTGHVALDDLLLSGEVIRITPKDGTSLPKDQLRGLAQDIFPEVRKLSIGHLTTVSDTATGLTRITFPLLPL
ncbi:MAG: hypothetical protein HY268_03485 [Deltaproteobacteria bacterium]|nr:hypothetical protein [Deltaproteobacteria bacterium]